MWKLHFVRETEESWVLLCLGRRPALVRTLFWQFFCELSFKFVGTCKGTQQSTSIHWCRGKKEGAFMGNTCIPHDDWITWGSNDAHPVAGSAPFLSSILEERLKAKQRCCYFMTVYIPCGMFITFHYNFKNLKTCFLSRFYLLWWCFTSSNLAKVEARESTAMKSGFWRDCFTTSYELTVYDTLMHRIIRFHETRLFPHGLCAKHPSDLGVFSPNLQVYVSEKNGFPLLIRTL